MKTIALLAFVGLAAAPAMSQVTGNYAPSYGPAVSVQTNGTGFGDSNLGDPLLANGSELNAAFYRADATYAYLLFTGNLESNFNKFELFISTGAAGQQQINSTVGQMTNLNGLFHDNGFNANRWFSVTGGNNPYAMFVDGAEFSGGSWNGGYLGTNDGQGIGGGLTAGVFTMTGGNPLVAIENSNTGGVTGSSAAGAASVTTGIEIAISWASLGLAPGSMFSVMAFINGSNHDYASNQFLAPLPAGTGNLGSDGTGAGQGNLGRVDLRQFGGNQYFVVPTPAAAGIFALAALAAGRRRR